MRSSSSTTSVIAPPSRSNTCSCSSTGAGAPLLDQVRAGRRRPGCAGRRGSAGPAARAGRCRSSTPCSDVGALQPIDGGAVQRHLRRSRTPVTSTSVRSQRRNGRAGDPGAVEVGAPQVAVDQLAAVEHRLARSHAWSIWQPSKRTSSAWSSAATSPDIRQRVNTTRSNRAPASTAPDSSQSTSTTSSSRRSTSSSPVRRTSGEPRPHDLHARHADRRGAAVPVDVLEQLVRLQLVAPRARSARRRGAAAAAPPGRRAACEPWRQSAAARVDDG